MDHACKVEAHILFYITGVGITILLMNLLVGVLSNNFELYEDKSAVLFLRARAKLMLELQNRPWKIKRILQWLFTRSTPLHITRIKMEIQARPWKYILQWFSTGSVPLHKEEKEEDSSGEPSCAAVVLFLLCFGPLVPLFLFSENILDGVIFSGVAKRGRCGSLLILLFSPMLFTLSACLALILMFCRLVFQVRLSGIFYMVAVSFGCCGEQGDNSPEDCHIGLVIRAEPPMEELRSLRSEMKTLGVGDRSEFW